MYFNKYFQLYLTLTRIAYDIKRAMKLKNLRFSQRELLIRNSEHTSNPDPEMLPILR